MLSAPPDEPIRVAFLARSLEATGGAEQQLAHIALGLDSTRFDSRVYCFYETGELCMQIRAGGIRIDSAKKRRRWDIVDPALRLHRALKDFRPHILHSFMGPPNVMAALLKPLMPDLRVVWGIRASDMRLENYDWTWRAIFQAEVMLSRIPDAIVANAEAGRQHVTSAGFPEQRVSVLPNGIDTQRFSPDRAARERVRTALNIAPGTPVIGMIARIDPQKDHGTLLHAARRAITRMPDLTFLCVGGGRETLLAELQAQAVQLGIDNRVRWLGETRDVPAILNALDLVTLSSSYGEGFPNAIGEAMACGKVCAVTDVGDCAAIVGHTGYVSNRGDQVALAENWLRFLQLPAAERERMGERARQRIADNYSLQAMVSRSESLYQSVLARTYAASSFH